MDVAVSKNKVPIRLTQERWHHISTGHPEIAGYYYEILETIESPSRIYEGTRNEYIAVSGKQEQSGKFIVVIYKETGLLDGFIITAFISNKKQEFDKKKLLWKQ